MTKYEYASKRLVELMNEKGMVKPPSIFISHKSIDKDYGHALRDFIIGLGVKDEQLIYTSHEMNKIPLNENIYDYLRKNIYSKIHMIILWSDDYLESPACLNEMGACWVAKCDYTNIYVPNFSFNNPKYHECVIDTNKMGAILSGDKKCRHSMLEFKNIICNLFNLSIDERNTMHLNDTFTDNLNIINKSRISYESDKSNDLKHSIDDTNMINIEDMIINNNLEDSEILLLNYMMDKNKIILDVKYMMSKSKKADIVLWEFANEINSILTERYSLIIKKFLDRNYLKVLSTNSNSDPLEYVLIDEIASKLSCISDKCLKEFKNVRKRNASKNEFDDMF